MDQSLIFDAGLIAKYDQSGPRYTSYPTAVQFHSGFGVADYRRIARATNAQPRPLSLYFHLPFCDTVCFYCACNKVVTKDRRLAAPYLQRLEQEIALQAELFDGTRPVEQLHWGGGTPTFISEAEMAQLMAATRRHFTLADEESGEFSVELDPREAKGHIVQLLRELGFNRVSLGVQDFEPRVQAAVNRFQTEEETLGVMEEARRLGFRSISLDLIYGLPLQTLESFGRTLDKVIACAPDRLSVFNYAHLPELFKPQRRINADELPSPQHKLDILELTIERLTGAGYLYIGMDHFARPDDELAKAQREGTLYRNFQGYSTHADCDLIGLGVTSIGMLGSAYAQNRRTLEEYYQCLDSNELAVFRGVELSLDDRLRRDLITSLICHFSLDIGRFESRWGIDFHQYFATELARLGDMEADGLVELSPGFIQVRPKGRLLIRNICMAFDAYLNQAGAGKPRFSKVI